MAHITKRKRADGSTAYRSDIRIIRKGAIIHQESRTFDRMVLAKAWEAKREAEIQEQDVFGIQKSVLIKTFNGHFVVAGNFKLVDMWQGTIIGSVADTKGDAQGNPIETCNIQALQKAVVATKLLDIEGVPYIFLPSKIAHRGGAKSFKTLLEKDLENEINGR